ncbi:enoyl-CoA hydratase/isomerase family protein [Szabonella alba]|uniref:3-hydroxyisobutyryl-CoA hydrolase n=1 Tax=Szabonella alba TaxID=2804194 RepID=A0A8K0VEG9_9RHOB|nr:enoyl-CoA hydratase/isomerase family protein [Szabonella alba]MBL4917832.1 enoyl-CoA hydratase/isomerase family protein [Szabonella alba]
MSDIHIRIEGRAGRITLNRPQALNALTHAMCLAVDAALCDWRNDPRVDLVLIDAEGDRAFCSGGDIAEMYASGRRGDYGYGRRFWRDEYRMNARLARYLKPVVSFLQGFTMGGGVGLGCHAQVRIVGESSQIAMPECGIGLVPDVGGSMILACAPGRIGVWAGVTGARLGPADAITAGFADRFVPMADWPALKSAMIASGDPASPSLPPPAGRLADLRPEIDRHFAAANLATIARSLAGADSAFALDAGKAMARNAPLSMACTVAMLDRLGSKPTILAALEMEYRFTHRAMERADFLEGIRAAIIDRDRNPHWRHAGPMAVPQADIDAMLAPLGVECWTYSEERA